MKYKSIRQEFNEAKFDGQERRGGKEVLKKVLDNLQFNDGTTSSKCLLAGCDKSTTFGQVRNVFMVRFCFFWVIVENGAVTLVEIL